jgi:hypothetical protein
VEICDNDKDDDGDYKSDCQDVDCADFPACKEEEDECVPGSSMSCGMAQIGQVAADSDGIVDGYSCSEHSYPGGEEVYQFEAPCTGKMQVSLTVQSTPGNGAVIDLMLLDPDVGCKGSACVAAGLMSDGYVKQAKLSFEADSGEQFYVVVEGREGASGSFSLLATCSCN